MEITCIIHIDEDILQVLVDYKSGNLIDSEYFLHKEDLEKELHELGLMEGGFYSHYPLSPTQKGEIVLEAFTLQHVNMRL